MTETDDFLDGVPYATPAVDATDEIGNEGRARRRVPAAAMTVVWLVLGLVAGAIGVAAWHSAHTSASASQTPAATGFAPGSATGGQNGLPGGSTGGQGFGGQGFGGRGFGGFDGEQHIVGTLSAVGTSTITVTTSSGTTTYRIDSSTQLVKNGQQVSSLSVMHAGDRVLVHVYPLNGTTHVERVIDGPVGDGFGGPGGPGGAAAPGGTTST